MPCSRHYKTAIKMTPLFTYSSTKMTPQEFELNFLPADWKEQDLQHLLYRRMRAIAPWYTGVETRIQTATTTRRADISNWFCVYEVKKYLTRDAIFHAVAQTELYAKFGRKILWIIPKQRVVIGVAPRDYLDYKSAVTVAEDFRKMGIGVIFINESPNWRGGFGGDVKPAKMLKVLAGAIAVSLGSYVVASMAARLIPGL